MSDLENKFDWGWVIFLILILWFFIGGNGFGFGRNNGFGNGYIAGDLLGNGNCRGMSNCEIEKTDIKNTARTQFMIEQNRAATDALITAKTNVINSRIDGYEWEHQKDKVNDLKMENVYLKNQLADSERFHVLTSRLDAIECNMAKAPKTYPYSYMCPAPMNPCGFNGGFQTV